MNDDYLLLRPAGYDDDPGRRWPLIVFLHGAGESGGDLERVRRHGPPKVAPGRDDFPFLVLAPHSARGGWDVAVLDRLLDDVVAAERVDEDRIYLTGLSMGGFGAWAWAAARPGRFAALAPICGGGDPATASRLIDLPIWNFHGARDEIVPMAYSEVMVDALRRLGANVRHTIYPDAEHDSWTRTYDNPDLYAWFLQHRRRDRNRDSTSRDISDQS